MSASERPTLVVFQSALMARGVLPALRKGHRRKLPLEALVNEAQASATLDLLDNASSGDTFERILVLTDSDVFAANASSLVRSKGQDQNIVSLHSKRESATGDRPHFHFGERLRDVCAEYNLQRVVYIGGGAMPLGTQQELDDLALAVSGPGECVTANNLYSADVVAFTPASALERIDLPATDNDLAWLLHYKAGLPFAPMLRTLTTQFDIDTPTDLATLWWSTQPPSPLKVGPHLAEALSPVLKELPTLAANVERAYRVMSTRRAEVLVAGRVSSWVWRRLEINLPCQTRIVSEERGMRASGRDERGEVRSLLGLYSDLAGISGLVKAIEQVCQAAFVDTRVLFAHRGLKPSAEDRFASDALMPNRIADPWIRELTEAMWSSSIPIVLGGHSLVSGGVWALSERVRETASAT